MHITIVSYTFPPSKAIGGRRWAKFAQQFSKKGIKVTVVTTNVFADSSFYINEFPGVSFHFIPKKYPAWLTGITNSLLERVLYKIATRVIQPILKINLFDKGFAWKTIMLNALEKVHKKNKIDILIVTGAPYSLFAYSARFKQKYPDVYFISDLRDPWTWGSYYGIPTMGKRQMNHQLESERIMMQWSDMVCFPVKHMGDVLNKKYKQFAKKLNLLPHAFEPEKFPKLNKSNERNGFIYGGTLYSGIEGYLEKLSIVLKSNPCSEFNWSVYTGKPYPLFDSLFSKKQVQTNPFIPEEKLFEKISSSAAYLVFFPPQEKDLISTKFFEIIYTETPIIYIGEEGEVGRFIRDNKLGVHILPENIESEFPKYLNGDIQIESETFNLELFTYSSVTDRFLEKVKFKMNND